MSWGEGRGLQRAAVSPWTPSRSLQTGTWPAQGPMATMSLHSLPACPMRPSPFKRQAPAVPLLLPVAPLKRPLSLFLSLLLSHLSLCLSLCPPTPVPLSFLPLYLSPEVSLSPLPLPFPIPFPLIKSPPCELCSMVSFFLTPLFKL